MQKDSDAGTKQSSQARHREKAGGSALLLRLSRAEPSHMRLTRRELLVTAAAATLAGCAQATAPPPPLSPTENLFYPF